MIQSTFLEGYLRGLFASLSPGQCMSVGWSGSESEGANYSYHTHPDGTRVRIIWAAQPTAQNLSDMAAAINAYVEADAQATGLQNQAIDTYLNDLGPIPRGVRAVVKLLVSEINLLRERLTAQDAAVAAATSLANLQNRWATVASNQPMPDRTMQQAATAIQNAIQGNA